MWDTTRGVLADAVRDLVRSWKPLALTSIAYKAIAFAILSPAAALLIRWLLPATHDRVITDAEILTIFVTTRGGFLALIVGGAVLAGIVALETACLMAIGIAATRDRHLVARDAILFGATRVPYVLGLTAHMVVRVVGVLVPFLLVIGLVYLGFLRRYDINYYLAQRPPAFWAAAVVAVAIVGTLAALLVRMIARWALALPLVLFEKVLPRKALGESARRSAGHRAVVLLALAVWAISGLALLAVANTVPEAVGRGAAPLFAGSPVSLVTFIAGLAVLWGALALAVGVVNGSLFALVLLRLYLRIGEPRAPQVPAAATDERPVAQVRVPRSVLVGGAVIAVLGVVGLVLLTAVTARRAQPVAVIAHRGSSATAPENSLAAFRLAVEQGTDFVELDVQESSDGEVLVVHDSDLMKAAGAPMKIWETDAATLRSVDIGSRKGPQYGGERVPTLAEALQVCKGRSRVIVELKSYGHDQRLEERVTAIVEAAGMENDCVYMSLDHDMVKTMKRLRPSWRCGVLAAKALGDLRALGADFLAVEAKMATPRFVRRAHRAGQDVYVWTVNDPAWMLATMSRGADGLITDKPDLARQVVARRDQASDAQRILVALLIRLGARTDALAAEDALRP